MDPQPDCDVIYISMNKSRKSKNYGQWQCQHKQGYWSNYSSECSYGNQHDCLQLLTNWATQSIYDDRKSEELQTNYTLKHAFWSYFDLHEKYGFMGRLRGGQYIPGWIREKMPEPEILSIGVRRIQDITESECMEEGVIPIPGGVDYVNIGGPYKSEFATFWNRIYGSFAWERNDWVWNIRFQSADELGSRK
jgi:hypothetical protein